MPPLVSRSRLASVLALALLVLACGGGGGGGGGGGNGTGVQGFGVIAGPIGTQLAGLNQQVILGFTRPVDPATVDETTINLVTVEDAGGQSSAPPGLQASVEFSVDDKRVIITPTLEFDPQNVTFGFVADALYEISFGDPDVDGTPKSVNGAPMTNANKTFFFRTPTEALDTKVGFPGVRAFFVDDTSGLDIDEVTDVDGDLDLVDDALAFFSDPEEIVEDVTLTVPFSPIREIVFIFDDAVIPQSVFNTVDGSSPAIRVLLNSAALPDFVPIIAPATLGFLLQQKNLTIVRWRSDLAALPPDNFLLVEVNSGVEDLAGNSKLSLTGDFTPLISAPVRSAAGVDPAAYPVFEGFDDSSQRANSGNSANWASPPGVTTTGIAGGLGLDGNLVVDPLGTDADPRGTDIPLESSIDFAGRVVSLPTVREVSPGVFEPRVWEFRRVLLPKDWSLAVLTDRDGDGAVDPDEYVVQSAGHPLDGQPAPLSVRAVSDIDLSGEVRVEGVAGATRVVPSGPSAPGYADYLGQGGVGAAPFGAAGAGGDGGDVLLAVDTDMDGVEDLSLLDLVSPAVRPQGAAFEAADPRRRGVTGRSSVITATTLTDDATDLSVLTDPGLGMGGDPTLFAQLQAGRIRVQPNVGVGSSDVLNAGTRNQLIDENHPTFVVQDVAVSGGSSTITIVSDDGESMVAASDNIANEYAPIAAAGDSYVVGRFEGLPGADPSGFGRSGAGALPFLVVNEGALGVTTTGGGGGGAGGVTDGSPGGDSGPLGDPLVDQRGQGFGGIALPDSPGAAEGPGAVRGTGRATSDTSFEWVTQTAGVALADVDPADVVGAHLVPNAPDDGWMFEVVAFDGLTFEVARVQSYGVDVGLTSGPAGVAGPGLSLGQEVGFLLVPPDGLGGAGGGGSGVSVTGTLNAQPTALPLLSPGAGGGSGGGVVEFETAATLTLRGTARLSVNGGDGGEVAAPVAVLPGGGGGSGGSMTLRAGVGFLFFGGATVEARGGAGGGTDGSGRGGDGGDGWLRLENLADSLVATNFLGFTDPVVGDENLGRLVGEPRSVAESRFYNTGLANPEYESITVEYSADTDGDGTPETGLTWGFTAAGIDGGPDGYTRPPFRFRFNPTEVDINGQLDVSGASPTYYEPSDLLSGRAGFVFDPLEGALLYSVGEDTTMVHDLDGSTDLTFPDIPPVGGSEVDIVSMTVGGATSELYLLERGTGRVLVFERATGVFQRTIFLPEVMEGALAYVPGMVPDDDRLYVASNRSDLVVTFRPSDPGAAAPLVTDYRPKLPESFFRVARDGEYLDIEFTGLALDATANTLWAVDPLEGTLVEFDITPGSEGVSTSGVHAFARLVDGGLPVIPSALAHDGTDLHVLRSVDPDETTRVAVDPATVSLLGGDLELPDATEALPEVARSIADGKTYLRFRLAIDGTTVDDDHLPAPVAFTDVAVDSVELVTRNVAF